MKRVVETFALSPRLRISRSERGDVPRSVTTSVTSVIKNHEAPTSQGGPDTRPFALEPKKSRATIRRCKKREREMRKRRRGRECQKTNKNHCRVGGREVSGGREEKDERTRTRARVSTVAGVRACKVVEGREFGRKVSRGGRRTRENETKRSEEIKGIPRPG